MSLLTIKTKRLLRVYFCNIHPIDRDLHWSVTSKLFMSEKLIKAKDFCGTIQLAAGNTLWLHPVTSWRKMEALDLSIVEDCISIDLKCNNYAVHYDKHLLKLKELFAEANIPIAEVKRAPLATIEHKRELCEYKPAEPYFAFLIKQSKAMSI